LVRLPPQPSNHIEQNRKHHAEENRSREWEIENSILAAINNIAGEPTKRKIGSAQQNKRQPDDDNSPAEEHQQFAQIRHSESPIVSDIQR
jgi:hypothetical protein